MSSISVISSATGVVDAFRTNLLRRAESHRADLRLQDLAVSETTGSPRGSSTPVGGSLIGETPGLRASRRGEVAVSDSNRSSFAAAEGTVSASAAPTTTQSLLPATATGDAVSSDPLRVLNGQTLPIPRDAADIVTLFLQGTGSRLLSSGEEAGSGTALPIEQASRFGDLANIRSDQEQSLLRPDLHTPLNSQIPVSAANVSPEVFPTPLEVSGSSAVVPALAGTALMQINSGESAFRGHTGAGHRSAASRAEDLNRRRMQRASS